MIKKIIILFFLVLVSCNFESPKEFSKEALNEKIVAIDNSSFTLKEVLNKYKGKKILIDVWASWCADCIRGLPKVKKLQKEFPDVVFLFLSVDKNRNAWKNGINRFLINGEHYNLSKGMKNGDFVDFINLNWIPRYLVVNELGDITLFKSTDAADTAIQKALKAVI
ncbi:MAG: TlpA family protein disulfide reductase [Polaribacter sp.]